MYAHSVDVFNWDCSDMHCDGAHMALSTVGDSMCILYVYKLC